MDNAELTNRFAYHKPSTDEVASLHESVRAQCLELAEWFNNTLPEGRDKAIVFTKLEEVMYSANAAVARNQPANAFDENGPLDFETEAMS